MGSGLGWLIFGNLKGGLKNQAVREGLKTTQLCMLTAVCTPIAVNIELPTAGSCHLIFFSLL